MLVSLALFPAFALAGVLPISIPGLGGLFPTPNTTSKYSVAATGAPISKPTGISISSVSYSGSGCPSGSVSQSLSSDKTVITLGFDAFQAYIGPGTSITDRSKTCNLLITLKFPLSYSFSVISATYHGYAQLDPGVTGSFRSTYLLSSLLSGASASTSVSVLGGGAFAGGDVYTKTNSIATGNLLLSPCLLGGLSSTAVLTVNNALSLASVNASASGLMTDDDASFGTTQRIALKWFSC